MAPFSTKRIPYPRGLVLFFSSRLRVAHKLSLFHAPPVFLLLLLLLLLSFVSSFHRLSVRFTAISPSSFFPPLLGVSSGSPDTWRTRSLGRGIDFLYFPAANLPQGCSKPNAGIYRRLNGPGPRPPYPLLEFSTWIAIPVTGFPREKTYRRATFRQIQRNLARGGGAYRARDTTGLWE